MPMSDPLDREIEPDTEFTAAVQAAKYVRAEQRMRQWFAKLVRGRKLMAMVLVISCPPTRVYGVQAMQS